MVKSKSKIHILSIKKLFDGKIPILGTYADYCSFDFSVMFFPQRQFCLVGGILVKKYKINKYQSKKREKILNSGKVLPLMFIVFIVLYCIAAAAPVIATYCLLLRLTTQLFIFIHLRDFILEVFFCS